MTANSEGAEPQQGTSFSRIPELDGLRGLAILGVITDHYLSFAEGYGMFHKPASPVLRWLLQLQYSGWIGVDLFFALSGFLITGILVDSRQHPRYFRIFYIRRTLRIFPVYFLLLLLWSLLQGFFSPGNQGALEPNYSLWLWTYTTNILIAQHGWLSLPVPLRHLWSLAIEEQFYLLWPLIIYFLDRRKAIALCMALMLLCPLLRVALSHQFPPQTAEYVLMPARIDSLATGGLMALLWRSASSVTRLLSIARILAGLSLVSIFVMFAAHEGLRNEAPIDRTWGLSALAIFFSCAVLLSAASEGSRAMRQALRSRTLRWFGKYSYGLYIWHSPVTLYIYSTRLMPILARAYSQHSMWLLLTLVYAVPLIASVLVAYLSWHLWEQPFLKLKKRYDALGGNTLETPPALS